MNSDAAPIKSKRSCSNDGIPLSFIYLDRSFASTVSERCRGILQDDQSQDFLP